MLNFIAIDLQLYKIFKITRVLFFWHTVYKIGQKTNILGFFASFFHSQLVVKA